MEEGINLKSLYQFHIDNDLGTKFINKLPEIESKIDKLENRKKNFQEMRADGDISKNDFRDRMNEVENELKDLYRNKDRILNIEREINSVWEIYEWLIIKSKEFDINTATNDDVKKLIARLTHTTIDGIKVPNIEFNNGLNKDFSTIMKEYTSQYVDY